MVLGSFSAFAVVALTTRRDNIAVRVIAVRSGNHVFDHMVFAVQFREAVEAFLAFALEDQFSVFRNSEEIHLLKEKSRLKGGDRNNTGDILRWYQAQTCSGALAAQDFDIPLRFEAFQLLVDGPF